MKKNNLRAAQSTHHIWKASRPMILALAVILFAVFSGALMTTGRTQSPGIKTDYGVYPEPPLPPLPPVNGVITDPTFGTQILRATDQNDCPAPGCGTYYSHWPTFNLNNTKLLIRNEEQGQAILKDFNPVNFTVGAGRYNLPNSIQNSNCTNCAAGTYFGPMWESATWSNLDPNIIFTFPSWFDGGLKLFTYNVQTHLFTQIADLSAASNGTSARFAQMYMSANDDVFCWIQAREGSVRNPWGFTVYKRSTNQILFNVADNYYYDPNLDSGGINEVHVDKSGKWLHVVVPFLQSDGTATRFLNLQTGAYQAMTPEIHHSPGHGDMGTEIMAGFDNYEGGISKRHLSNVFSHGLIFRFRTTAGESDWTKDFHGTMLANNEDWMTIGTYLDYDTMAGANGLPNRGFMSNEIAQVSLDGSHRVRRLAHTRSVIAADTTEGVALSGIAQTASNRYTANPKPTISKDGKFIAFTSNWGNSARYDLFILKIDPAPVLDQEFAPFAPTNFVFLYDRCFWGESGTTSAVFRWTDNSDNEAGFRLERLTGTVWSTVATYGPNVQKVSFPYEPGAGGSYYRVRAFNSIGESAPSNQSRLNSTCYDENYSVVDVTWTNLVNASAEESNLTAVADSARGETTQSIASGNGSIIHTVDLNTYSPGIVRIGLINNAFTGDPTEIDYHWKYYGNGPVYPSINNVAQTNYFMAADGDTLEVRINGTTVEWLHNNVIVHSAPSQVLSYPYRGVVQATANGDGVLNVKMKGVAAASFWTSVVNASTSGTNVTATSGNARAETTSSIASGNGGIKSTVVLNNWSNGIVRVGLINGAFTGDPTEIDYHWKYWLNGAVYPCINNTAVANYTLAANGDTLEVRINGTTVEWYHNNTIVFSLPSQSLTYPYRGVAQITTSGDSVTNVVMTGAQ